MKKLKTNLKLVLALAIVVIAMCLFNANTVNAANITSTDGKVFTKNEIMEGLVGSINTYGNTERYFLEMNSSKMLDLLYNTQKLDKLIKSDKYVYQNIYLKVDNEITKAVINYRDQNKSINVNIVTIDNVKYAEIPLAVVTKINGVYYPANLIGDGIGVITPNSQASIQLFKDTEKIKTTEVLFDLQPSFLSKVAGAHVYLTSDTNKKYYLGGAGSDTVGGNTYNRVLAEGNCYINVDVGTKVGETLQFEPFGTLTYKGITEENGNKSYTYRAKITDKTIFNKDIIISRIALKDYKVLHTAILRFEGDLIKVENIKLNDTATNVIMESNTNIIPKDTVLIVKSENSQIPSYEEISKLFDKSKNFKIFDISLQSNGTKIQPNGKVKLTIPVPSEFDTSKLCVYRVDENNQKIKYDIEVIEKDGTKYVTFETDHFSIYVLEEEQAETNTTEESKETKQKQEGEKDETPKTGATNSIHFVLPLAVVTTLGLVIYCKKQNK